MKITRMRIKGQKLGGLRMANVVFELKRRLNKAGFLTGINVASDSGLKIGLHMCSFRIDTTKHDRNLRFNPHLGSRLTTTPTWDQRVEFNDIINAVLTKFKVSANIKSGPFTIRQGVVAFTESEWQNQKPEYIKNNECRGYYVESCDEQQYLEERRIQRNKVAAQKRKTLSLVGA